SRLPQRYAHALSNARHRLARVDLDDAFQRANVVELKWLLKNGAAARVPVAYAEGLAGAFYRRLAVVFGGRAMCPGDAAGEFLFHFGTDNARRVGAEFDGRLSGLAAQ